MTIMQSVRGVLAASHLRRSLHDRPGLLARGRPRDAQQATAQPADLVITNGKVVTVEDGAPEAQAVASRGGRIVAVGSSRRDQGAHRARRPR